MIEETMNGQNQPEIQAPAHKRVESEIESKLRGLILEVFNNPVGLQLLDMWDDVYIRQITWKPGVPEGFGEYRAGQNQVILSIRAMLNQAKMEGAKE